MNLNKEKPMTFWRILFILQALLISAIGYAQTFTKITESFSAIDVGNYANPTIIDINGNGLLDLFIGDNLDNIRRYEQSSSDPQVFSYMSSGSQLSMAGGSSITPAPAFIDLDGDNRLDFLIGSLYGNIYHYEQQSVNATSFTWYTHEFNGIDVETGAQPTFTDLDGDGLLDMLVGEYSGNINHYEQNAPNSVAFSLITTNFNSIDVETWSSPIFTDLDGDDLLDMLVGEYSGNINHYEQNAPNSEAFSLITASFNSIEMDYRSTPIITDHDGDGRLDLFIGANNGKIHHWESESVTVNYSCVTTEAPTTVTSNSAELAGEITDDNCHRVFSRGFCYSTSNTTPTLADSPIYLGGGTGSFTNTLTGLSVETTYYVRAFAISSLGAFYGEVHSFTTPAFNIMTTSFNAVDVGENAIPAFTDIDGDGLLDMLVGAANGNVYHYEQSSDETTSFTLVTSSFVGINITSNSAITMIDLDGDGLLDALFGRNNGTLTHYEQNSDRSNDFTFVSDNFNTIDVNAVSIPRFTDLDGDGKLDLLIGQRYGKIRHYEQNAVNSTSFTHRSDQLSGIDIGNNAAPDITDLDDDGLLDLLIGRSTGTINRYEQSSVNSTSFSLVTTNYSNINTGLRAAPVFTDLDGDGSLDLLVGGAGGTINHYESVNTTINSSCVTTTAASSVTNDSATLGGSITDDNSHPVTRRGICFSTSITMPTLADFQEANGSSAGSFSETLSGLFSGANYFFRAFSTSALGTFYGPVHSFNTESTVGDYTQITATFNSIDVGQMSTPTFTDLDGDGLMDMLIGELQGHLLHYEQVSVNSSSFTRITTRFNSIDVGAYAKPTFTDLDSDGLLDLLIGEDNGKINHYEQSAVNSFSFALQSENFCSIDVGSGSAPTVTDLDDDGLLDLLIGEDDGALYHYEQSAVNSNSFAFFPENFVSVEVNQDAIPTFTDIDGDGLLDLLISQYFGDIKHYKQQAASLDLFSLITNNFSSIDVGHWISSTFTDIDGDNRLDLLIGELDGNINRWESSDMTINSSCVTTNFASSITQTTAVLGGAVTDDNCQDVFRRGVCYSETNAAPTLADSKAYIGRGKGSFSGTVTGLKAGTFYHMRGFCSSALGTFYGPMRSFTTATDIQLSVKVLLEGPYIASSAMPEMSTDLSGSIPKTSPYADGRTVTEVPSWITDWVYLELRTTPDGAAVFGQSFFLSSDGYLSEDSGSDASLNLSGMTNGDYYIVIRHRNHLAVMSEGAVSLSNVLVTYDFSSNLDKYHGGDAAILETNGTTIYGMYAGDADGSGTVDANDRSAAWNNRNTSGYITSDCCLSGTCDANSRSATWNNRNKSTNVP